MACRPFWPTLGILFRVGLCYAYIMQSDEGEATPKPRWASGWPIEMGIYTIGCHGLCAKRMQSSVYTIFVAGMLKLQHTILQQGLKLVPDLVGSNILRQKRLACVNHRRRKRQGCSTVGSRSATHHHQQLVRCILQVHGRWAAANQEWDIHSACLSGSKVERDTLQARVFDC